VVDPVVLLYEREGPRVAEADPLGRVRQRVEFHPSYHDAGRAIWRSGLVGAPAFDQAAAIYLLTYAGEGGHTCPAVCTAGLVRALRRHGPERLRADWLPSLLDRDYDSCHRGSQFLTEVQGGSDVGANAATATADGGCWRISGEKWFCSVADAEQFLVTARPEGAPPGTRGIGCFLVPREIDGEPNGFRLRRLKDKVGTRALATGEIEFEGALGFAIGDVGDGFRIAVGSVLNTSRWLNALGCAGLMRRAYLEALGFSRHRVAFGRRLVDFPLVRENLAWMKAEEHAALASSLELTSLVARLDAGEGDGSDTAYHRFLVNANKVATSLAATDVARRGIEALGGNGTIEDFSPLPRLWRDAIVLESWEGTHNVLCAQVLRDLGRRELADAVLARVEPPEQLAAAARASLADAERPAPAFRRQLLALVRAVQVRALREHGEHACADLLETPAGEAPAEALVDAVLDDDAPAQL
jgi:alkylation response protein AidB-like acyl-CoA dehydrogenase